MPGRIYALANQKGGVGKTTTAVNLAACLAEAGERALVVDLDPQANATSGLGERANGSSTYDLLDGAPLRDLVRRTKFANLDLVPSKPDLAGASVELARHEAGDGYLAASLAEARERYGFVFIDCPPSLGLLTLNALVAADAVLIPLHCEYFALEGLADLVGTMRRVRAAFNPVLEIEGVLLTMYDERTNLGQLVARDVREFFREKVFNTIIPRNVKLSEAPSHGIPGVLYDAKSRGAAAYVALAQELLARDAA